MHALCLLLGGLTLATGCASGQPSKEQLAQQQLAKTRLAQRTSGMGRPIALWGRSEVERPAHLRRTLACGQDLLVLQTHEFDRNFRGGVGLLNSDARRFAERQPEYVGTAATMLYGKPEMIPLRAIVLFF